MAEEVNGTGGAENTDTGSNEAANQDLNKETPAANQDDLKEVVRQRDRANEKNRTLEEKVNELDERVSMSEAEREKNSYVETLVKKHGLTAEEKEVLDDAVSPSQADKLAETLVKHREDAKQAALADLQNVGTGTPRLDPDTAKARLKELEGTGNVEEMLNIKLSM